MIKEVAIKNFRCLRDVTVRLGPLTVLVGPNASGKSTFLEALRPQNKLNSIDQYWRRQRGLRASIAMSGERDFIRAGVDGRARDSQGSAFVCQLLRLRYSELRAPNMTRNVTRVQPSGRNLTNLFMSLGRQKMAEIGQQFCGLVPVFSDVDVRPTGAEGHLHLLFQDRWNPELWYTPDQVSDGTMLMLAYLLVPYQDPAPDIIAIEEPERGLHPYLLQQLVNILRKLSQGQLGPKAVQVVAATHSAELLEFLEPEEVRFFDRSGEDGAVKVREVPSGTDWETFFEEYQRSLGTAWLSGTLGGVPGREG
jgi:predicted ATPase